MAEAKRKHELIDELGRARNEMTVRARIVGRDLDFRTRGRRAFARHPAIWIGVALVLGLFVSRLPFRRKKAAVAAPPHKSKVEPVVEKAGIAGVALGVLKIAFDLARPALTAWLTRRLAERFAPSNNPGYTRR
ncbi:MAG TPA: hypothetical protein VGM54_00090 [Chthoniobacter sp.]|jgi:hypothetical protein